MGKMKLYLVTDSFPYGKGEKSFIIPELPHLTDAYDVTILTKAGKEMRKDTEDITKLDEKIPVINIPVELVPSGIAILKRVDCIFSLFHKRVWYETMKILGEEKTNIIKKMIFMLFHYSAARDFIKELKKKGIPLDSDEPVIFYTYWNTFATLGLLFCKEENPNIKVITRTHGYDLYNERVFGGRQPFREYENITIDGIFFVSEQGMNYYINHFSEGIRRPIFHLNRLGVHDCGRNTLSPLKKGVFHLVSCSNVIPLKRVELIVKALSRIKTEGRRKIHWVHFGNGNEMGRIQQMASELLGSKENFSYALKGAVPNKTVLEYYQKYYVDCFITTTSTEGGCPVSIMEACSFGIPIIGINVGGGTRNCKRRRKWVSSFGQSNC